MEPAGPETIDVLDWGGYGDRSVSRFHYDAVEIRSVDDSFISNRPGLSWFRLKYPLVAGEESDPLHSPRDSDRHGQRQRPSHRPRSLVVCQSRHHDLLPSPPGGGVRGDALGGASSNRPGSASPTPGSSTRTGALGRINQAQLIEPRQSNLDGREPVDERTIVR